MLAHMDELVSRDVSGSSVTARYHGLGWKIWVLSRGIDSKTAEG